MPGIKSFKDKVSKMSELVWTRWHVFVGKRSMKRNVPKPPKPMVWSYKGPVFLEGVFPECLCQSNLSSVIFCQWHRSASKLQRPGVSSPANQNNSNDNNLVLKPRTKLKSLTFLCRAPRIIGIQLVSLRKDWKEMSGRRNSSLLAFFYARDASVKTVNKTTLTPSFKGVVQTHLTDDFNFSEA